MRVYLDACCLNRPFDDQSQERIRLEAEAVILILNRVERKDLEWVGSEILDFELTQAPDADRVIRVSVLARFAHKKIRIDQAVEKRAWELGKLGFDAYDALHLACAEKGGVEVFLTTDDRLVRLAHRLSGVLRTSVKNPLIWLSEVREP